jgi:uncharacterized RDD family membrane protein YckC
MQKTSMRYAGFWPRLGALLLDIVVLTPLALLAMWATSQSRWCYIAWEIVGQLIGVYLYFYMVGRYGGSPGKLIAGLRIVRLDGQPVGYARALLRNAPDLVLSCLVSGGLAFTVLGLDNEHYLLIRHQKAYTELLKNLGPDWVHWADIAGQAWLWSELAVLLTNDKRRALHDFLAGTVVIHKPTTLSASDGSDRAVPAMSAALKQPDAG